MIGLIFGTNDGQMDTFMVVGGLALLFQGRSH